MYLGFRTRQSRAAWFGVACGLFGCIIFIGVIAGVSSSMHRTARACMQDCNDSFEDCVLDLKCECACSEGDLSTKIDKDNVHCEDLKHAFIEITHHSRERDLGKDTLVPTDARSKKNRRGDYDFEGAEHFRDREEEEDEDEDDDHNDDDHHHHDHDHSDDENDHHDDNDDDDDDDDDDDNHHHHNHDNRDRPRRNRDDSDFNDAQDEYMALYKKMRSVCVKKLAALEDVEEECPAFELLDANEDVATAVNQNVSSSNVTTNSTEIDDQAEDYDEYDDEESDLPSRAAGTPGIAGVEECIATRRECHREDVPECLMRAGQLPGVMAASVLAVVFCLWSFISLTYLCCCASPQPDANAASQGVAPYSPEAPGAPVKDIPAATAPVVINSTIIYTPPEQHAPPAYGQQPPVPPHGSRSWALPVAVARRRGDAPPRYDATAGGGASAANDQVVQAVPVAIELVSAQNDTQLHTGTGCGQAGSSEHSSAATVTYVDGAKVTAV
mmetsp:Transcript_24421/g.66310  ORF Transcript_24421/g.66310 Transcript_24421/m.66310 type:complete len:498 (+) Transcript_24421:130-1623(+)